MRKNILTICAIFIASISIMHAQVSQVNLAQEPGIFTTESLTLASGDYQFNIANKGVAHEVGFVLVPKGKYEATDHIKEAYVTSPVAPGQMQASNVVSLEAGEYEYFCPMNKTKKYTLTVVGNVQKLTMNQVPGAFAVEAMTVSAGTYQFEVANNNVGHDVGFVLVPKGKYEPQNHIQAAYVSAPVKSGDSGMTGIVELAAGEYEYFCPLNPTPKYSLTVK